MKKVYFWENKIKREIKIIFYMIIKKITKKKMIIDISGTLLTPGNLGEACRGNGKHLNYRGTLIECCCDECDYMLCCLTEHSAEECLVCTDSDCPHSEKSVHKK